MRGRGGGAAPIRAEDRGTRGGRHADRPGDPGRAGPVGAAGGGDGRCGGTCAVRRSHQVEPARAGRRRHHPAADRLGSRGQRGLRAVGAGHCRVDRARPGLVGGAAAARRAQRLGRPAGHPGRRANGHHAGDRADQRIDLGGRGAGQHAGRPGGRFRPGARHDVRAGRSLVAPPLNWIAWVAHTLARWPNATVPWPATPAGATVLALGTVCVVFLLRRRWFRALAIAGAVGVSLVVVPVRMWVLGWPVPGWLLVACEVGQGDALVLTTGEPGAAIVVDTGPDPGLVDGCLSRLGIGSIALVVLTHLHADHVDGLPGALAGRSVGAIAVGPGREPAAAWHDVNQEAEARGVPVVQFRPGDAFSTGAATLTVLGPDREFHGTDSDPNNDSLVIMADLAGTRVLLTGDIEIEAQQALLNARVNLDADVLKVPHHGSADLLERFVDQVSPVAAVIGVGADNDYGHPSPKTLDLLARAGTRSILRTDTEGDVAVGVRQGTLISAERGATLRVGTP